MICSAVHLAAVPSAIESQGSWILDYYGAFMVITATSIMLNQHLKKAKNCPVQNSLHPAFLNKNNGRQTKKTGSAFSERWIKSVFKHRKFSFQWLNNNNNTVHTLNFTGCERQTRYQRLGHSLGVCCSHALRVEIVKCSQKKKRLNKTPSPVAIFAVTFHFKLH